MSKEKKEGKEVKKHADASPQKVRTAANKAKNLAKARESALNVKDMKVPRGTARANKRKFLQGV